MSPHPPLLPPALAVFDTLAHGKVGGQPGQMQQRVHGHDETTAALLCAHLAQDLPCVPRRSRVSVVFRDDRAYCFLHWNISTHRREADRSKERTHSLLLLRSLFPLPSPSPSLSYCRAAPCSLAAASSNSTYGTAPPASPSRAARAATALAPARLPIHAKKARSAAPSG